MDQVFAELERHVSAWFGKKKRCHEAIEELRKELASLKSAPNQRTARVKKSTSSENSSGSETEAGLKDPTGFLGLTVKDADRQNIKHAIEREYQENDSKIHQLSLKIPSLKARITEVFQVSGKIDCVFIQLDDFYHIQRSVQPHVMDYIHRLCKDVPLFFKVATLRHSTTLYIDRDGQPTGAQERHDYQPINIDYNFSDARKTESQLKNIFHAFAQSASMKTSEFDELFKGEGFRRLVLAGGGVPRDCLSLFLEVFDEARGSGDGRIGKDNVRILSLSNLERRIEELKSDSQKGEQDALLRGIYVLLAFCISRKTNVFLVPDKLLKESDSASELFNRLLDYRIIHHLGSAYTHKKTPGTFAAYLIDIGAYGHLRKLEGKMREIDVFAVEAKERIRAAPILTENDLGELWKSAPDNPEAALLADALDNADAWEEQPEEA